MARTDPESKDAGGVSAFIVERETPGLTVGKPDRKMGQRGAQTADVIFDNARVPAANIAIRGAWRTRILQERHTCACSLAQSSCYSI